MPVSSRLEFERRRPYPVPEQHNNVLQSEVKENNTAQQPLLMAITQHFQYKFNPIQFYFEMGIRCTENEKK